MPPEILVIREKDRFSSILMEQGFSVTNFPVVETKALEDLSELENCLAEIENFDGIFITSSKAAEIVLAKLNERQKKFRGKFYALGKRSEDLLEKAGYEVYQSESAATAATADELLGVIPKPQLVGKNFLYPCGNRSLRVIPERLGKIARVQEVVVYQTVAPSEVEKQSQEISRRLREGKIDVICFFSPSGVEGFLKSVKGFSQNQIKIAAIGQTTAAFAREKQLRVDFVSRKPGTDDFAFELKDFLQGETDGF